MIKVLMKSIREYKAASIVSLIFIALEVIPECLLPYVMADLIDTMTGADMNALLKYSLYLVLLAIGSLICGIIAGKAAAKASTGFAANLRSDMFMNIEKYSFENIDKYSSSSLVTRLTTDVNNVQNAYGMLIRIALRSPFMLIFSAVMAFRVSADLAWIYAAIIPLLAIAIGIIIRISLPRFNKIFTKYDALNESVEENVSGIRVVKSYVREDYEKKKFAKASDDVCHSFIKAETLVAFNGPVMQFAMYLSLLLVSVFASYMIVDNFVGIDTNGAYIFGKLSTGDLSSLITYGTQMLSAIMMFSMFIVMLSMSIASAKRIAEVLAEKTTISNPANPVLEVKTGDVEFKNVDFKYSKTAERIALSDINLKINSGETIGIIGGTGSSKSTLVNLISRLYDTTDGEVLVGGVNVKDYDIKTLRNSVAVVLQKNVLFSGTIRDNLKWGNENATDSEVMHVCDLACASEFINLFPDKLDTKIDQGGTNVSGGQKQRLCIARALLKNPKVIILDDSTSAVDTKTDSLIRKSFKEFIPTTTKIVIAQRISSVSEADKIIVLDGGKINGIGTHSELLKNNEIYREVYESQNKVGGEANA